MTSKTSLEAYTKSLRVRLQANRFQDQSNVERTSTLPLFSTLVIGALTVTLDQVMNV